MAKRIPGSDYRFLIACAYIGFLLAWRIIGICSPCGCDAGKSMEKTAGLIPLTHTIFTSYNLFITLALLIVLPIMAKMMMPTGKDVIGIDPKLLAEDEVSAATATAPVDTKKHLRFPWKTVGC